MHDFALVGRWGAQGLAFSYSAAYVVAAVVAFAALRRRTGRLEGRRLASSTGRVALATAVMGAVVWLVVHAVGEPTGSGAIVRLLAGVASGVVVFGAAVLVLRVQEVEALRRRLRRN